MRLIAAIFILIFATVFPWYVLFVCAIAYGLYWSDAYELIFLGLLVDAYFGSLSTIPLYTLGASTLLLVLAWTKPRLLVYTDL